MGDFGTKLYTASLQPLENEALFQYYYRLLPRERRRKTDRMRNPAVRRESLGAGVLLCLALADFGICSGPEGPADGRSLRLKEAKDGKPYLEDYPELHFNLSHSAGRVLCILSEAECGCDAEKIHLKNADSLLRCLSSAEADWIREVSGQERILRFTRLWTLKESYVKAVGKGLQIPLNSFEVRMKPEKDSACGHPSDPSLLPVQGGDTFRLRELSAPEGYCFSCCWKTGDPGFSAKELDLTSGGEIRGKRADILPEIQ